MRLLRQDLLSSYDKSWPNEVENITYVKINMDLKQIDMEEETSTLSMYYDLFLVASYIDERQKTV